MRQPNRHVKNDPVCRSAKHGPQSISVLHTIFFKRGSPHCLDGRQSRRVQPIQATHIIRYYNKRPIKHHADKNKRNVCLPTIDDKSLRIINKLREWKSRANGSTCSTGGRLRGVSHLYKQHSHSCLTIISFPPLFRPSVRSGHEA